MSHLEALGIEVGESEVRYYSRRWPTVFTRALNATVWNTEGRPYIDFFSSAGALNFGHNHPELKRQVIAYLEADGVISSLDLATEARQRFIDALGSEILRPIGLPYLPQFVGPTGADAVEAALKLALKTTRRRKVIAFEGSYHGMTAGALSVSHTRQALTKQYYRQPPFEVAFLPFEEGSNQTETEHQLERAFEGPETPAAAIIESVQCEGGIRIADHNWLRKLTSLCRRHNTLLILDEIQSGMGRTGTMFGFQQAGIVPDIVLLSKSLGGIGMPISLVLLRRDLDAWVPGEHTGTFRGFNLSFVAGAAALKLLNDGVLDDLSTKEILVGDELRKIATGAGRSFEVRGTGMLWGLDLGDSRLASTSARRAFEHGLLVELCGPDDTVVKIIPPLTIGHGQLQEGLAILAEAVQFCGGQA